MYIRGVFTEPMEVKNEMEIMDLGISVATENELLGEKLVKTI